MKSLKVKLELNNKQNTLALKHAGVARYAYNWGKSVCDLAIKSKLKRPTSIDLHKKFVAEEKQNKKWLYDVSKCRWYGSVLTVVDRFYASSKICNCCEYKNNSLKLSDREWICPNCGVKHERDNNVAINLEKKAVSYTASACGALIKLNSEEFENVMKQEENININNIV